MNKTLLSATIPGQSGFGSDGKEVVLCIPQSITAASSSDCLVAYQGHSLESLTPLQRSSRCILWPHADWAMDFWSEYANVWIILTN